MRGRKPKNMTRATAKEVMTPEHRRWKEFCNRLAGPEGCDFKDGANPPETTTWKCTGGEDRPCAVKILKAMRMDVAAALAHFDENGGHCDCEILFNVQ